MCKNSQLRVKHCIYSIIVTLLYLFYYIYSLLFIIFIIFILLYLLYYLYFIITLPIIDANLPFFFPLRWCNLWAAPWVMAVKSKRNLNKAGISSLFPWSSVGQPLFAGAAWLCRVKPPLAQRDFHF